MRAVGYRQTGPIDAPDALLDIELAVPKPGPRDLLIAVRAVSVNPIDTKRRRNAAPPPGQAQVLGFDAAGVVCAVGSEVSLFTPGDPVFYAGTPLRQGSNAQYQLADERLVGHMPASLSFEQAAAMPLTALTAWEILFTRLGVPRLGGDGASLLVIGGAGGVGSMLIQLARQLTSLKVIATASRDETRQWCLDLGAHEVIDHRRPLQEALRDIGIASVAYIASLTQTSQHWPAMVEAIAPQGRIALIDDPDPIDIRPLKTKSVSVHWEWMCTRSVYATADMIEQHHILEEVSRLSEAGILRSTLQQVLGPIDAATLRRAHAQIESGSTLGKLVLSGFGNP
ncbi:zinc-binding alcohol dehydrogenase family protein [Solimonas aquatica]|uniref:Zinc-type alcohol dehydrogenase-like protein n=1 Tax=Solimonas aquatica TaxID=489703 RepID=A0A1H9DYJ0_9GAMM|nr:zinc-binding alcohol dehydrogenase family protein [Solimonas aquatica]SEQ18476.1 zinc-binding alcohol dehydrogenase family protein [Solimonas aquatica]